MTTLPLVALALLAQASVPLAPVRIGGEIKEPRKVKDVAPEYPEEAIRAGLQGAVILECTLDLEGSVTDAKVVRGALRLGKGFDTGDMADVLQELEQLRASDPSEQVRETAARSIAQIQQK